MFLNTILHMSLEVLINDFVIESVLMYSITSLCEYYDITFANVLSI